MLKAARILTIIGKVFSIISIVFVGLFSLITIFGASLIMAAIKDAAAADGTDIPEVVLAILPATLIIMSIVLIVVVVLSLVFANMALKKLNNHEPKTSLIAPAILMIIFSTTPSLVAGILLLAAPSDLYKNQL